MKLQIYNCIRITSFLFGILLASTALAEIPPNFCITNNEYKLYELINAHRKANGLPELNLSISLCFVATTHVADLVNNHPDTSICNLNSWSNKGDWMPCCHSKYLPKPECILGKPRELTNYRGDGHELAYWEMFIADPDSVIHFWINLKETNDFILNREQWKKYRWRSIGIGILEGYAVIWVGQEFDRAGSPEICKKKKAAEKGLDIISIIGQKTNKYYVICASFNAEPDAVNYVKELRSKGYAGSNVIHSNVNYRVSLSAHGTLEEAKQYRSGITKEFRNAWILHY